jgi:iron complex outermembrane receptor protein
MSCKVLASTLCVATATTLGAGGQVFAAETDPSAQQPQAVVQQAQAPAQQAQAPVTQSAQSAPPTEAVTVTARRIQERLQDVPISVTVYTQQQLSNQNIVNASDLAKQTTSLSTDTRFGQDNSSFSIRGFTQEIRTTSSVGVFFDDVVAPRGGGAGTTAGDGAGPGDYFDLQNVQVLKGPQGTLFGRNTTGGDVLLTPNRPTDQLGGYIEDTVGNLDLERIQGVINAPITDNLRVRLGFDRETRDGYENNVSGIGPSTFGDVNYYALRLGIDADITPELNNYTVATYSNSDNNGTLGQIFACNPAGGQSPFFGPTFLNAACAQVARQQKLGFFDVQNAFPDPTSANNTWRVINTTTWDVDPELTIKNIASYAQFRNTFKGSFFGDDFTVGPTFLGQPTGPLQGTPVSFTVSNAPDGFNTNDQATVTDELQFQGTALDKRLTWQGGLYFELSYPNAESAALSSNNADCPNLHTIPPQCIDILGELLNPFVPGIAGTLGGSQLSEGTLSYHNLGVYTQETYAFTDQLKLTAGLRYTSDLSQGEAQQIVFNFPTGGGVKETCDDPSATLATGCFKSFRQHSEAPTGVIDLEYTPVQDLLLYSKYSRGYRQGGVDPFGPPGFNTFNPEQIDAYELGEKSSFKAPIPGTSIVVPGTLDFDLFYNNLHNQQLQAGFANTADTDLAAAATTGILNAGESRIYGAELDSSLLPIPDFRIDLSGAYLNTKLVSEKQEELPADSFFNVLVLTSRVGGPLPLTPKFKGSITGTYRVPLPETLGRMSVGLNYSFTGREMTSSPANTPFPDINSAELLNLFANWDSIDGSPVSLSFFANNLTDNHIETFIPGFFGPFGFETRNIGEPLTFGFRVRYAFGG